MNAARPLGVYVHWPFCARICPYCDFNVYRARDVDMARWTRAFVRDLEGWAQRAPRRPLTSLYFGGGTPSLAPPSLIAAVIGACDRLWGFAADAEITLEANPNDAAGDRLADFANAGVNRLSLGVQSFDDDALAFLGRDHDGRTARRAIAAGLARFSRLTFDLIYARPGQSLPAFRAELAEALATGVRHLSLYQLTVEEGTPFARAVARDAWAPAPDAQQADLYEAAQELTDAAGLCAYEISNHAAPGDESRHNLLYWTGADYIGIGPGAHGRLTIGAARIATLAAAAPAAYLQGVEAGAGAYTEETLTPRAVLEERLAAGLRLAAGIDLTPSDLEALSARAAPLIADGLITVEGARIAATRRGRQVLNAVLAALLVA